MPRMVPSQVVKFIDKLFPQSGGSETLGKGNSGQLRAIANLVDEIPDELLTMDSDSFAGLVCSVAYIRQALESWSADRDCQTKLPLIPNFPNETAVTLVRKALAKCPDGAPAPSTTELNFITDVDLRANLRNDIGAINRALANGEWKAATVLAGSAIEALLLWDLQNRRQATFPPAVTALVANHTFQQSPPADVEEWTLHHYVEVEAHLGILKPDTATETRLAKKFRNLIHPGRVQRLGQKCERGTARVCVGALDHVVRDLTP